MTQILNTLVQHETNLTLTKLKQKLFSNSDLVIHYQEDIVKIYISLDLLTLTQISPYFYFTYRVIVDIHDNFDPDFSIYSHCWHSWQPWPSSSQISIFTCTYTVTTDIHGNLDPIIPRFLFLHLESQLTSMTTWPIFLFLSIIRSK